MKLLQMNCWSGKLSTQVKRLESETEPEPISEPIMYRFSVNNGSSAKAWIWIDTDNYSVVVPEGIVNIGETKLVDYVEEGNHFLYGRTMPDTGVFWANTRFFTADYTWNIVD